MEITFLGTSGGFPTAKRSLPAVAVRRKGELLLFDCGEGTQRQMVLSKIGFRSKMKIFITHMHGDHVMGIPGILQTMSLFDRKSPLKIYGPEGIYDFISCIKRTVNFGLTFPVEVYEVGEGLVCDEGEYTIQAIWVEHSVPCLAYALVEKDRPGRFYPERTVSLGVPEGPLWSKLQRGLDIELPDGRIVRAEEVVGPSRRGRKVVYVADTKPCGAVLKLAEGADLLIYEATLDDSLAEKASENYHSTPSQGAEIARKAGVRRLILTHISGRYLHVDDLLEQARRIFPTVEVAEDLMEIKVPYID